MRSSLTLCDLTLFLLVILCYVYPPRRGHHYKLHECLAVYYNQTIQHSTTVGRRCSSHIYNDKNIMTVQVKSALVFLFCFFLFLFLSLVLDFPLFLFWRRQLWLRARSGTGSWRYRGTPLLNYLVSIFILGSSVLTNMIHTKSSTTQLYI